MTLEITVYTALNNVATWVNQKRTDLPCINLINKISVCVRSMFDEERNWYDNLKAVWEPSHTSLNTIVYGTQTKQPYQLCLRTNQCTIVCVKLC